MGEKIENLTNLVFFFLISGVKFSVVGPPVLSSLSDCTHCNLQSFRKSVKVSNILALRKLFHADLLTDF